jgi:hypothetical protein
METQKIRMVIIVFIVLALPMTTLADNILPGKDYFHTVAGTWFNFGSGIGVVNFMGNPIDPDNLSSTDTIVERKQEAMLPDIGSSDTIDIELVALSLKSMTPVLDQSTNTFLDVFVMLDLGADRLPDTGDETSSVGTMTISHEINWPDDGMNTAEGTFDSVFDLYLDALFVPVGKSAPEMIIDINNLLLTSTDTLWTHTHDEVPALPDTSNFFLAAFDSFSLGLVMEEHPGVGVHAAENVPEPTTILLLSSGLLGLAVIRIRRR